MRFFRSQKDEQRLTTCPSCCQLVSVEARRCDMCGADLEGRTADGGCEFSASDLVPSGNPYAR